MALNKWKYGIPKKEEPKQTKKMDKTEVFNQTFAPTLPFVPTEPGQHRLDFSSNRTQMTELPKTTQVKAPITGKTFSLDNVKTFNAPKEEVVNNRPLVNDELNRIKSTVKEKFDIDIDKRGKPFQVGEAIKESKLSDADKKELARLLVQYETLKVEESPAEQLKTSFAKGFSPVETTKLEKEYLDDPTRYQETLETTASKVGNFGGNLAKYAALYYLAGPAIAGTGGSTAGGVGAGVGTLNTTIAQRLGYNLGTGTVGALTGELAKDVVLGTALGGVEALQQGQKGRELAKTIAQNILMDAGFNAGGALLGGVVKGFKTLDEITKFKTPQMVDEVAKAMDIPTSEASKVIDDEINFYVNQYGTASPNQFEQLQLPAPEFKPEFKSDTFASTLRNKTNDIYVNQFGVADTKPFEQLQLEAPKNIASDTSAVRFRDGVQPQYKGADFKGELSLTERKYPTANLGDRKIKAFQFNNPEVQPFYREKAEELLLDATYAKRGSRKGTLARDEFGEVVNRYGDPRVTTPQMARILDETGSKYEDIQKALQDLIDDNGKENHALAKKIENVIDDMLVEGYVNVVGETIKPNIRYIQLRNRLDTTKIPIPELEGPKASQLNNQLRMGGLDESGQRNVFDADMQRTDFDDFLDASMPSIAKPAEGSVIKTDITADPFNEAQEDLFEQQLKESNEMIKKNLKNLEGETYRITSNKTKNSVIVSKRGNQIQATMMDKDYKPMMDRRFDTYDEFVKNFLQDPLIDGELKVSFEDYTPAVKPQLPKDFTVQKPQYPPLAKPFAKDVINPVKPTLKPEVKPILNRDFTIQKPTYPKMQPEFTKERPSVLQPSDKPNLKVLAEETTDPVLRKFRLDLFGAKPTKPIKALLGENEVEVTSLIKDTATLKDGRVVNVKDLNPVKSQILPTLDKNVQAKINTTVDATDDQLIKSVNKKIARDIPKKKKTFAEKWNEFKKNVEDDVTYFGKLEKDIKGFIGSAEDSIYKQARLFKGAPETANEFIRTRLAPVLKNIEKKGYSTDDLGDYALMMHAKDVNAEGLNSGFTNQEIEAVLKKYSGNAELETARQELLAISDDLLDQLAKDGLLDTAQLLALKTKWKNYMPLFRAFDDDKVEFARGISDAFSNVTAPIKKLKGSDRNVIDPIESMIKNIYQTTSATMRNRVGLQLAKLAELDVDERFIRKLTDNELVGRKNVVNVTESGKKVAYEVDPEVYKTFNNLDKETSNFLIDVLSKPASVLRAGATLTPEFALRNPFRDIQTAFVNSESGFTPLDFVRGLASSIKKDDLYSQWLKEGGGYGSILSMDRNAHQKVLKDILKQSPGEKFVNIVSGKDLIKALRGISDLTEAATKVGEFGKALKKGASPQEAAYRSRDLMDFSRSGSSIRQANKIVAFLNANIQGKSKLIRSIKERPVGTMLKMTTSMTLPTVGFYALNENIANEKQRQTIDEAPDWLKNTFWLVAIPGTDLVARLPKPFDMSIFANGTERFLDYVKKNDKEAFDGFIRQSIKDQSIPTMISGVVPFFEVMSNYSTFRESPIIPLREQYIKSEDQYDNMTSEIAKLLAGGARKVLGEESKLGSPRAMDYLLKTSTAGLGTTVLDASDWLASTLGISDRPSKAERGITNFPGLKGFLVSETMSGKSVGEVYDLADELQKKKGSLKLNLQAKLGDRYDSADLKAAFREQDQLTYLNSITDEMSDISKELRKTNNSTTLTPQEKRKIIEDLTQKRNALAIKAIEKVKEMNK